MSATLAYEAAATDRKPQTPLDRARDVVILAAHRRPAPVLKHLDDMAARGETLPDDVRELLVGAAKQVASPGAVSHINHALSHELPLNNNLGKLAVERGTIIRVRDIHAVDASEVQIPPATDLSGRHVYIDSRLRVGQEGLHPDVGGPAARWQQRPDVRMSVLRQHPMGPLPDVVHETSTGTRFDYIAPSDPASQGRMLPAVVIRASNRHGCDDRALTPVTSDDCANQR